MSLRSASRFHLQNCIAWRLKLSLIILSPNEKTSILYSKQKAVKEEKLILSSFYVFSFFS